MIRVNTMAGREVSAECVEAGSRGGLQTFGSWRIALKQVKEISNAVIQPPPNDGLDRKWFRSGPISGSMLIWAAFRRDP